MPHQTVSLWAVQLLLSAWCFSPTLFSSPSSHKDEISRSLNEAQDVLQAPPISTSKYIEGSSLNLAKEYFPSFSCRKRNKNLNFLFPTSRLLNDSTSMYFTSLLSSAPSLLNPNLSLLYLPALHSFLLTNEERGGVMHT